MQVLLHGLPELLPYLSFCFCGSKYIQCSRPIMEGNLLSKGVEDIMDLGVGQRRLGVCVCLCTLPMVKPMPRVVYHDMVVMAWWGKYCTNTTHFLSFCLPLRSYQCLPLQPPSLKQKPCLFVWSQFEDHSFRLHQANWLSKMADRLVRDK